MQVIAYTYDADYHCESCMLEYARSVPYSEYDWNPSNEAEYDDSDISDTPGPINVATAVELEIIKDGEGNPIRMDTNFCIE